MRCGVIIRNTMWAVGLVVTFAAPFAHAARQPPMQGVCMLRGGSDMSAESTGPLMSASSAPSNATTINETNTSYPEPALSSVTTSENRKAKFFLFRILSRRRNRQQGGKEGKRVRKRVKKHTVAFTNKMNEKIEDARRVFLDRMAAVSFTLINQEHDATMDEFDGDDDTITPQSDLCLPNRSIYVVTTAALPWRTGTAVNPLLRAAYLHRRAKEINNQTLADDYSAVAAGNGASNRTDNSTAPLQKQMVTLVIPWLELEEDRIDLYGREKMFSNMQEQEDYIRDWLRNDAQMPDAADPESGLRITFYPARYHSGLKSIFAMGDICATLRNQTTHGDSLANSVCILEEPEHLNWYRAPGEGWTKVFSYVVGIVHTNYIEYAGTQFHGLWTAPAIQVMSSAMIRAYCHKVIKLSGVLQSYAPEKESISNVHGVREDFINEGRRRSSSALEKVDVPLDEEAEGNVYYIGKILWAKGFEQMLELEEFYRECTGKYFSLDVYGGGPEEDEIKRAFHGRRQRNKRERRQTRAIDDTESESDSDSEEISAYMTKKLAKKLQSIKLKSQDFEIPKTWYEWRRRPIPANFLGPVDHASLGQKYNVFVNPSVSEVLCTTTFEALAMGKFVIIPRHESNAFFLQFPNCLSYRNKWEFAANLRWALTHEPEPLTPELAKQFTWEAATDRLIQSSAITMREARERARLGKAKLDERIAFFHRELGKGAKGDALRKVLGGGPVSSQVKYEMSKRGLDQEGSENEGLTQKFKSSSFVRAIKSSFSSVGASSGLQGGTAYFT